MPKEAIRVSIKARLVASVVIALSALLGGGSLVLFMLFLFSGALDLVGMGLDHAAALCVDGCLCLLFFVQHSGMIRKAFRERVLRSLPAPYHGAVYSIASGLALLALVVFWQESGHTVLTVDGVCRWLVHVPFFLGIVGFAWGSRALGTFDPFGIQTVVDHLRGTSSPPMPFVVRAHTGVCAIRSTSSCS
jgi:methanethiol S-methyltransferase